MPQLDTHTHPKALWSLSLIYALYAIAYGVLFANLLIYSQSKTVGFTENYAFEFMASFTSLTFILPLIGGSLADKYGFKNAVKVGLIFCIIGFALLSMNNSLCFYLGVSFALAGNALSMPSIWSMVGMIYNKEDSTRESGATIFYFLFNIGFLISFSCSPLMATYIDYHVMFAVFGTCFVLAFIVYILLQKKIEQDIKCKINLYFKKNITNIIFLILFAVLGVIISLICLMFLSVNQVIVWGITALALIYLIYLSLKQENKANTRKIYAFILLCILAVAYITIYNSEFNLLPDFIEHNVNSMIGSFDVPSSMVVSLDPLFCIIIGFLLGKLWVNLSKKDRNPSLSTKFSLGLIISALGYILLSYFIKMNISKEMSILLTIPVFVLFVCGELLVLPIGIAMSGRLSPEGKEGLFMGVWNLIQGTSALVTGYIASFTVVNIHTSITGKNLQYFKVFIIFGAVVLVFGVIAFCIRKHFNKLAH